MRDFKFFNNNEDEEIENHPFEGASWMWCDSTSIVVDYPHDIIVDYHYGIHSFLRQFRLYYVVSVVSITGPNDFEHNITNDGTGWGFDITRDLIMVRWVRFRNDNEL